MDDEPFEINIVNPAKRKMLDDMDLGSQSGQQSNMDDDIFDEPLNLEELRLFKFYSTLHLQNIVPHLRDSEHAAKLTLDDLINDCSIILYDKYIESKMDDHVINRLEDFMDMA